jgi:hypothetical protein
MTLATVPVYDAIRVNVSSLPHGQAAGYATGTGVVPWGAAEWAAHPGAVRIDQTPVNTPLNELCDVLDIERGAATVADAPGWSEAAAANFAAGRRHGQRAPAVYVNMSNLTSVVNALVSGKIASGVGLWIANWNLNEPEARAIVEFASGPWPVIGVQYGNRGAYDISVFSSAWLANVSGGGTPPPPPPGWTYPAPAHLGAVPSRAVWLSWPAAVAPAGHPAAGSYTVAIYAAGGRLVRQLAVKGLGVTVPGLGAGSYEAHVWANGAPNAPAHASVTFTA